MLARTRAHLSSKKKKKAKDRAKMAAIELRQYSENRGSSVKVSRDEILSILRYHENYTNPDLAPAVTVRNGLENMIDATPYGVSEDRQEKLWEAEVDRLVAAVTDLNNPLRFSGTDDLAHDTKNAYASISNLANRMWVALHIITHDCQGSLARHCPQLHLEGVYQDSREVLEQFNGGDDDDDDDNDDDDDGDDAISRDQAAEPNEVDYNELVNYLTATLARGYCHAGKGNKWLEHTLSALVKVSTKLKVISYTLKESVSTSLEINSKSKRSPMPRSSEQAPGRQNDERPMGRLEGSHKLGESPDALNDMLNTLDMRGKAEDPNYGPKTRQQAVKRVFWAESTKYQHLPLGVLRYVLVSLRGTNRLTAKSSTSYELSALLYDTIFDDYPTYVYQDIDTEYLGTSKPENTNVAQAVFEVLDLTMRRLEGEHLPNARLIHNQTGGGDGDPATSSSNTPTTAVGSTLSPRDSSSDVGTTITWYYYTSPFPSKSQDRERDAPFRDRAIPEPKTINLASMHEVVSVIVPLLMASPKVVEYITDFIYLCAYTAESDKVSLYDPVRYEASFCLSTREYREAWRQKSTSSVSQLSQTILARQGLSMYKEGKPIPVQRQTSGLGLPTSEARPASRASAASEENSKTSRQHQKEFKRAMLRMDDWVVEENGVRVRCEGYVWSTMIFAAVLVLGGIAAGLTIRDRLDPVDPFNITMFCWVVAAFVVLVAKSLLVAEWPWRDFLRRQVLCRSVSELHSVTGIDDQLILACLIQGESDNCLQTRGPYNSVFRRKTDSADGFSIDHPMGMHTMLLSGLIMIQVSAHYGDILVCLDLRKGTEFNVISQRHSATENREFIASDSVVGKDLQEGSNRLRIPLKVTKNIGWGRIVGVYGQSESTFI